MDFLKTVFGVMFWPLVGLFVFVVVLKTGFAIWDDVRKNLLILILVGISSSSFAQSESMTMTPVPGDVPDPLGDWGYYTSPLSELKLIREIQLLQTKIMVFALGAALAYVAVYQVKL